MLTLPFKQEGAGAARESWNEFGQGVGSLLRFFDAPEAGYSPALDVKETGDAYTVQVDLPGLDRKDLQVRVEDGVLSVRGERKAEHQEEAKERSWLRVERAWGSFERHLRLGEGVDPERVAAEYKDGVLTVTVPKKAGAQPRVVEVR